MATYSTRERRWPWLLLAFVCSFGGWHLGEFIMKIVLE